MTRQDPDPYLVLGVSPSATQAEITHAYRARLRAQHPDTRQQSASRSADDDLRQLLAAYALLRDTARRADYDRATPAPSQRSHGPTISDHPPAGRIQIPVTYRTYHASAADAASPPLRAGPVRRHR